MGIFFFYAILGLLTVCVGSIGMRSAGMRMRAGWLAISIGVVGVLAVVFLF